MDSLEKKIDYAVEIFNTVYEGTIDREQMLYKHFSNPAYFPLSPEQSQTANLHMRHMHSQELPDSLSVHS